MPPAPDPRHNNRTRANGETDMTKQLAGKIAWVTGAGTGIGEAAAIALAKEGAITILTGRRAANLENTAAQIRAAGGEAHVQPADLMKSAEVQKVGAFIGGLSGPIYTAAKHGVVAMSHTINMEECINGIRSSVVLPGEVATPILDKRPIPVTPEERARLVQSEDCGDLIRYIACLPPHLCIPEVMITPAWNRTYVANLQRNQR